MSSLWLPEIYFQWCLRWEKSLPPDLHGLCNSPHSIQEWCLKHSQDRACSQLLFSWFALLKLHGSAGKLKLNTLLSFHRWMSYFFRNSETGVKFLLRSIYPTWIFFCNISCSKGIPLYMKVLFAKCLRKQFHQSPEEFCHTVLSNSLKDLLTRWLILGRNIQDQVGRGSEQCDLGKMFLLIAGDCTDYL